MIIQNISTKWTIAVRKLQQVEDAITITRQRLGAATALDEVLCLEQRLEHLHHSETYYSRKLGTLNLGRGGA